jgi:hypothetical protein
MEKSLRGFVISPLQAPQGGVTMGVWIPGLEQRGGGSGQAPPGLRFGWISRTGVTTAGKPLHDLLIHA